MFLTLGTDLHGIEAPASDVGFLLHKNPGPSAGHRRHRGLGARVLSRSDGRPFEAYRAQGVTELVCEEKHMGSRAAVERTGRRAAEEPVRSRWCGSAHVVACSN